jgi:hypothetical protein
MTLPTSCNVCTNRFSLRALFEYVTVTAMLWAFAGVIGVAPVVALLLMSLALAARQGLIALLNLIIALLAADWQQIGAPYQDHWRPQIVVIGLAFMLAVYQSYRRRSVASPVQ